MRRFLLWWRHQPDYAEEALAAKIRAQLDQAKAKEQLQIAEQQSALLEVINERNHFSEKLAFAFGGKEA